MKVCFQITFSTPRKNQTTMKNRNEKFDSFVQHELGHQFYADMQALYHLRERLLKCKIPKNIPGINIEASTLTHEQLEGVFCDIFQPNKNIIDIVLGQVIGKGGAPFLLANAIKMKVMYFANPFYHIHHYEKKLSWEKNILNPENILKKLHAEIVPLLVEIKYFVTMLYGRFNLKLNTFTFIDCGGGKPLQYSCEKKNFIELKGTNLPLGKALEDAYHPVEVSFKPGDLFTFSFSTLHNHSYVEDQPLLPHNQAKMIETYYPMGTAAILEALEKSVAVFARNQGIKEDLTSIIIKINEEKVIENGHEASAKFLSNLSQLQAVQNFITHIAQYAPGNAERLIFEMRIVIDEIFCNVVKHGYQNQQNQEILIDCIAKEKGLEVTISDKGISFDPSSINYPSLTGNQIGGYGWLIIQRLCDHVYYSPKSSEFGWNCLRVFKYYISEEESMDLSHRIENQILVITINQESLDARVSSTFKENVLDLIQSNKVNRVILDISQLQFIDSSGLGTFLSIQRFLTGIGGALKLSCISKPVHTMFEIVSMHKIFEIFPTTEEAIHAF